MQHHLLTIELQNCYVHGYVMSEQPEAVTQTMNEMMDVAEQIVGGGIIMPVILVTALTHSDDKVRAMLGELDPKIAEMMATATTYHRTIVGVPKDDPINQSLMELH